MGHQLLYIIRCNGAPGFKALFNDDILLQRGICIEIGNVKNRNKNPVVKRFIQELEEELLRQSSHRPTDKVTPVILALAIERLNSKIRTRDLSAREMLVQRDQFTNQPISSDDQQLIMQQRGQRT